MYISLELEAYLIILSFVISWKTLDNSHSVHGIPEDLEKGRSSLSLIRIKSVYCRISEKVLVSRQTRIMKFNLIIIISKNAEKEEQR